MYYTVRAPFSTSGSCAGRREEVIHPRAFLRQTIETTAGSLRPTRAKYKRTLVGSSFHIFSLARSLAPSFPSVRLVLEALSLAPLNGRRNEGVGGWQKRRMSAGRIDKSIAALVPSSLSLFYNLFKRVFALLIWRGASINHADDTRTLF